MGKRQWGFGCWEANEVEGKLKLKWKEVKSHCGIIRGSLGELKLENDDFNEVFEDLKFKSTLWKIIDIFWGFKVQIYRVLIKIIR